MPELSFKILAENLTGEGLSKAKESISSLGSEAEGAHGKLSGLGDDLSDVDEKAGKAGGGGLGSLVSGMGGLAVASAGAGVAVTAVAGVLDASLDKVSDLADHTEKLSAALGETPEHASQMLFAFSQMGLSSDAATKDLDKFSKGLAGLAVNEDGTTTPSTALTKQLGEMGITLQDASGKALPMQTVLGELADKFKTMPDGPEKTAIAMQLFGKSGAELIPFLDQGAAGLDAMYKKSDQLGMTLTGNTIDAVHQTTQAHRDMTAAVDGLEVQIGTALMPVVANLATGLAQFAMWVNTDGVPMLKTFLQNFAGLQQGVQQLVQFISGNWGTIQTVMTPLVSFIKDVLLADWNTLVDGIKTGVDVIKGVFQIIIDLIHGDFGKAWQDLKTLVSNVIGDVVNIVHDQLQPIINIATGIVTNMRDGISKVLDGIKQDLVDAWTAATTAAATGWGNLVQGAEDKAGDLLKWVAGLPGQIVSAIGDLGSLLYQKGVSLITGLEQGIEDEAKKLPGQVGGAVQGAINSIPGVGGALSKIPGLAAGGIVTEPTLAVVGENGPEAVIPLAGLSTTQPGPLPSGGGGASGGASGGATAAQMDQVVAILGSVNAHGVEIDVHTGAIVPEVIANRQVQQQSGGLLTQLQAAVKEAWQGGAWTPTLANLINNDLANGQIGKALHDVNSNLLSVGLKIVGAVASASTPTPSYASSSAYPLSSFVAANAPHFDSGGGIIVGGDGTETRHFAAAAGGIIHEPIFGVGASGRTYSFGENGPETITPGTGQGGHTFNINIQALDASGVQSVIPNIAYELDRYLKRNGMAGVTA